MGSDQDRLKSQYCWSQPLLSSLWPLALTRRTIKGSVLMRLVQDSAEQIRRCEVSHVLKKVDHSPEGEEIMERLSHPLVGKPVWVHSPRS